ncbi:MAG: molybdopterin-dependent oxidoreductase, partial [Clostridia bacterium]|nr:molybdopterin-dependent oxidoreductase [Clostridia bacterium]
MQLLLGKPVYTEDITREDALTVKILRSPHANAIVKTINTDIAKKVPGVVDIYTWEDVPTTRFAIAGQTFPEPSPYDRLIIDRHVRFAGDAVAIIAAESEAAAEKAMRLIRVDYDVLDAVLDFHTALDNPVLVHPEEDWYPPCEVGGDPKRNLVASEVNEDGNVDAVMADCDIVFEHTYHTRAFQQAMMEPFVVYTDLDTYGRLHVVSSTQIVFHTRRILSRALGIPKSRIRVEKPRIGGGFGAKQTAVCDVYPAFVTLKTGRPARIVYTRTETQIAGSPRHEMEIRVKLGADRDGTIRALDLYTAVRGVMVVPELDLPGHCSCFNAAYPEIFGSHGIMCAEEKTFAALETLIDEVLALFPNARYLHLGGDEAQIARWDDCEGCRAYREAHDLPDVHALYAHYLQRMTDYVLSKGV